jgi:hypothetical protein
MNVNNQIRLQVASTALRNRVAATLKRLSVSVGGYNWKRNAMSSRSPVQNDGQ